MKRYWDTSALIEALHNPHLAVILLENNQWTRPHSLTEAFSVLTGGRLGWRYSPNDAADLIKEISKSLNFIELNAHDTLEALTLAQKRGIRGGRIHDWMHARAATKADATILVTSNAADFKGLEDGFQLNLPSELVSA